jgi:hypothetical protein
MYPRIEEMNALPVASECDRTADSATPEAELIIACLRSSLSEVPPDTDWHALATLSEIHGVLPLVHRSLADVEREITDRYFQSAVVNSRISAERMAAELEQLLSIFAEHDIEVIPLKGPVLAEALYGDITLRPCEDLDLLVRIKDFSRAEKVLFDAGWSAPTPADEFERQFFRDGMMVELHFGVASTGSFRFDLDGAWSRARECSFRGQPLKAMSETDLALYLLLHGMKHGFGKLIWVLDSALGLAAVHECSPREIVARAQTQGLEQVVYLGCAMILESFPQYLSEELLAVLAESPKDMDIARARLNTLLAGESGTGRNPEISFYLQTETEPAKRWRCRLMLFSPTSEDYQWTAQRRLPHKLAPFVRPFRLLAKYGWRRVWLTAFPPTA